MRDLRPYCLGFGFFWSVPMLMLLGVPHILAPSSDWLTFVWVQQFAIVVFLPLCAIAFRHRAVHVTARLAFLVGFLLSAACLLYVLAFALGYNSFGMSVATGCLVGLSCAVFFLSWQIVYANEGQARSAIYLPCSSVLAVGICLLLSTLPVLAVVFLLVAVLPFASAYTLWRSSEDMYPFTARVVGGYKCQIVRDVWKPVLCASLVCFVWSLSSHIPALFDSQLIMSMLVGFGAASLLLTMAALFISREFGVFEVYQAIFPLLGIVLFIPALLGDQWTYLMVCFLVFGSHLMKLLIYMMSATYAARTQFSPVVIYLLCALPMQIAAFLGDSVGFLAVSRVLAQHIGAIQIATTSLIVCFVGLMIVSLGRKPRSLAEPADDTLLINPKIDLDESGGVDKVLSELSSTIDMAPADREFEKKISDGGLSVREVEVVNLLLKGNSMAAISKKLFISENTTRGHMKRIYRKLEIHSRQELIDLVDDLPKQG